MDLQASGELHLAFKNFKDKHVREPIIIGAKKVHLNFILEIQSTFRQFGICQHLERSGSSFEGVNVRNSSEDDDLAFETLLIIDKHKNELQVVHDNSSPGYAWLKRNRGEQPRPELDNVLQYWSIFGYIFPSDLYVDPDKTLDIFIGELQMVVNISSRMKGKVKLSRRGSVIQMDVHPDSSLLSWGPRWYSVDLVPAYQVGGALYVSKPLKEEIRNRMTWRRSFSIQEKQNLSEGAKCVLHALNVARNREPGLAPLTSYHLKTGLFYEMDDEEDWSDHALVFRFLGVLRRLEISLTYEYLPHYFYREINLLSSMSSSSLRNMHDRIKCIRSSENELMEILKV